MGAIEQWGTEENAVMGIFDTFTPTNVVIIREPGASSETRVEAQAIVQPNSGMFEVTTPIYEGDIVEVPDPRGGVDRRAVRKVDINQSPFNDSLDHIEAHWR
jgi:hypothetical protein